MSVQMNIYASIQGNPLSWLNLLKNLLENLLSFVSIRFFIEWLLLYVIKYVFEPNYLNSYRTQKSHLTIPFSAPWNNSMRSDQSQG